MAAIPAADFPFREPHKVGRLVVPPWPSAFPFKARYDFVNTSLAGDKERAEAYQDPLACPPDANPMMEEKAQQEARNYAVENIPRFLAELAADDDDDLFGDMVEAGPTDPGVHAPSGCDDGVGGQVRKNKQKTSSRRALPILTLTSRVDVMTGSIGRCPRHTPPKSRSPPMAPRVVLGRATRKPK